MGMENPTVLVSQINPRTEAFAANRAAMTALLEQLAEYLQASQQQGPERYRECHRASGKLLARDRVSLLLDPDTPFLELMPLAGLNEPGSEPGASMIAGIGLVNGVEVLINASVP